MRTNWIAIGALAAVALTTSESHAHELELGFGWPHGVEVGLGLRLERATFTLGVGGSGALFEDQRARLGWRDRYFGVVARVTLALRFGVGAEEALDAPTAPD